MTSCHKRFLQLVQNDMLKPDLTGSITSLVHALTFDETKSPRSWIDRGLPMPGPISAPGVRRNCGAALLGKI